MELPLDMQMQQNCLDEDKTRRGSSVVQLLTSSCVARPCAPDAAPPSIHTCGEEVSRLQTARSVMATEARVWGDWRLPKEAWITLIRASDP